MEFFRNCLPLGAACAALLASAMLPAQAHEKHQHVAAQAPGYARQTADYRLPPIALVRSDGSKASLPMRSTTASRSC